MRSITSKAALTVLAAFLLLAGCTTLVDRKAYEGDAKGKDDVAQIKAWAKGVSIQKVDRYGYGLPFLLADKRAMTAYFTVLPGKHTVHLRYEKSVGDPIFLQNGSIQNYKTAEGSVTFVAEAGKTYVPRVTIKGETAIFSLVDMGTDYESRCAFPRKVTLLKNANMDANGGVGMFADGGSCQ